MKILIDDGMQISVGTGIGKYTLNLYKNIKMDKDLEATLLEFRSGYSRLLGRLKYLIYINSNMYINKTNQYDVILFTNYLMPFRKNLNSKYLVTVHDMVSYLHPNMLPIFYRYYNRFVIRYTMKNADLVFVPSETVESEIKKMFPQYAFKIRVLYQGIGIDLQNEDKTTYDNSVLNKLEIKNFFLFIGTIEKRKNINFILKAFIKLKRKDVLAKNYKLVLAGRGGYGYNQFVKLVKESGFQEDIIFTGYISDNDNIKLYRNASAYLFPTIYEGFGIPQVECMYFKLPIFLSDIKTNKEISKQYGEYFNLEHEEELVNLMMKSVNNKLDLCKKEELAAKYMEDFAWEKCVVKFKNYIYSLWS